MTFSHDEAARLVADPATEGATLAEIAAQWADHRRAILDHPAVYPGLADWIREHTPAEMLADVNPELAAATMTTSLPLSAPAGPNWFATQWSTQRNRSIIVLAIAAVLVVGGGTAAIAGGVAASQHPTEVVAVPTPTATATPKPKPTPTASKTPTAPTEIRLVESQLGAPFGPAIAVDEYPPDGATIDGPVTLLFPGDRTTSYDATLLYPLEDIQSQLLTLTGPNKEFVVLAIKVRDPAVGLNPEKFHFDLVMLDRSGKVIARNVLVADAGTQSGLRYLTGSATDVVGYELSIDGQTFVHGVNARTGVEAWVADGYGHPLTFGTMLLEVPLAEQNHIDQPCILYEGLDMSTGAVLWSVDGTSIRTSKGLCAELRAQNLPRGDGALPSGGVAWIDIASSSAFYESIGTRAFDVATGAPRTVIPSSDYMDFLDPITGYAPTLATDRSVVVYDTHTGETVYTVEGSRAQELDLRVLAIYDGLLYTQTTDGRPVVDLATGEVVYENSTFLPVGQVGKYTLYSDNVLSTNPRRLG